MRRALQCALGLAFVASLGLWLMTPTGLKESLSAAELLEQWVVPAGPLLLVALALLWGGRLSAGVGISTVAGLLGFAFSAWAATDARLDVGYAGPVGMLAAAALALLYGAIGVAAFALLCREPGLRRSALAGGAFALAWLFLAFLFSPVIHGLHGGVAERPSYHGRLALGNVRTLVACAEAARQEAPEKGYPRDVDGLARVCPDARQWLTPGWRGYRLTYTAKTAAGSAVVAGFEITARPVRFGRTGRTSLLADETGVVRQTDEDRPARRDDRGEKR
jgi:MFS family permease